jgi:hypothetical protein
MDLEGSVAKWCDGMNEPNRAEPQLLDLRGDTKQAGNEVGLASSVALGHVHRFDSL